MENGNVKVDSDALRAIGDRGRVKVEAGGYGAAQATWMVVVPKVGAVGVQGGGAVPGGPIPGCSGPRGSRVSRGADSGC